MLTLSFTSLMSEIAESLCAILVQELARRTGWTIQFQKDLDHCRRSHMLKDGSADLAWICGLLYTLLEPPTDRTYKPLVAPCMKGEKKPVYYAALIVRSESAFRTFEDLRGASWAYNESVSFSGYQILRPFLAERNEPGPYFLKKIQSGSHLQSIDLVRQGHVDTAAIDSTVLQILAQRDPLRLAGLRVIESIGPYPMPPLVISRGCGEAVENRLRTSLVEMHRSHVGRQLRATWPIERFVPVEDKDYDTIRTVIERSRHVVL